MKSTTWIYLLMAALVGGLTEVGAEEKEQAAAAPAEELSPSKTGESGVVELEEDWLDAVWTQIDAIVVRDELKLQETVTVSGVRGSEAADEIMGLLYYKGGPTVDYGLPSKTSGSE